MMYLHDTETEWWEKWHAKWDAIEARGLTTAELRKLLRKDGWTASEIHEALCRCRHRRVGGESSALPETPIEPH